ncbi:MAG TPA: glycosyl hydrolase 108 family protein [Rhodocyclaceae bacterium]|uniref:glycoside hydrolase family 108 protein n=1 Tax=Plasticicumulans sp. TaxID=2307179 RepID=UPI002B57DCE1|nr:glycosyl hydrolase 108 family protein [Rhodocyclaceae bacterium]
MTADDIIDDILQREGDHYTNRAADRGGPTKYGITQSTLSRYRGRPVSAAEVQALTREEARAIYCQIYVHPWEWIADDALRALMVDTAVQHGRAPKLLQEAANAAGARLAIDGSIGPGTRAAVLQMPPYRMWRALYARRLAYYGELVRDDSSQAANIHGWMNRMGTILLDLAA